MNECEVDHEASLILMHVGGVPIRRQDGEDCGIIPAAVSGQLSGSN